MLRKARRHGSLFAAVGSARKFVTEWKQSISGARDEAACPDLVRASRPALRFPAEFPKLIHAKTEGSPLFMADLVRDLRDRQVIALEESRPNAAEAAGAPRWTLAQTLPDIERELPESVRGMIERKIAQL